jgi:hypothetical protein
MEYLAENPWPLAGALGALALGFLIALKVTQQGKYLIWAAIAAGLMLCGLAIEHFWVTDNERIEAVVYDVAAGVAAGDADRVTRNLAPEATMSLPNESFDNDPFLKAAIRIVNQLQGLPLGSVLIQQQLRQFRFDYVKVADLRTHAGEHTRQGTAEFLVHAMGEQVDPHYPFATPVRGMGWSFGLRETSPGIWKVTRITPTTSLSELRGAKSSTNVR